MLGKIISKLREQFYNELFDNYTELKKEWDVFLNNSIFK
jgi:hemoglobin-like flavoprotein